MDLDLTTDALPEEIKQIVAPIATNLWLREKNLGRSGSTTTTVPMKSQHIDLKATILILVNPK